MTLRRSEHDDKRLQEVEKRRFGVPKMLTFDAKREASFQLDRLQARGRQAYWAGWIALLTYNVVVMVDFLAGRVDPGAETRMLFTTYLIGTAPCLAVLLMLRRNRDPRRNDPLLLCGSFLLLATAIFTNHSLTVETQVFDAFTLVLFPVAANIALPLSFRGAAVSTVVTVTVLIVSSLWGQRFPPDAQSTLVQLYLAGGIPDAGCQLPVRIVRPNKLSELPTREPTQWRARARAGPTRSPFAHRLSDRSRQPSGIRPAVRRDRRRLLHRGTPACPAPRRHRLLQILQ